MAHSVNLMTDRAQFRSEAERIARGWALAIGALLVALLPLGLWAWAECRQTVREHEALEAGYEPLRRLAGVNRTLAANAAELVKRERTILELSRERSALALLAVVNEAIEESRGAAVVDHIIITRNAAIVGGASQAGVGGKMTLSASSTVSYEASRLSKSLDRPPFTAVKIVSSETAVEGETNLKHHVIECEF
jgi:hypothetical protein